MTEGFGCYQTVTSKVNYLDIRNESENPRSSSSLSANPQPKRQIG